MVEVVAKALFASSSDSDDIEIFAQDADTEESDAPTDPELGRADYWTCIKCKNQKNNPMYRYCEKCYQVKKNHISTESFFTLIIFKSTFTSSTILLVLRLKAIIKSFLFTLEQFVPINFHFYRRYFN